MAHRGRSPERSTPRDVVIRLFRPDDTAAVYDICLRTGADGHDATGRYDDPLLFGQVWAGPFLALEPQHALVLEDATGVAGYCLAALDTRAFEAACETSWWPELRRHVPDPGLPPAAPGDEPVGSTSSEILAHLVHHPPYAPDGVVERHPSHLHIDLVPRAQGRGLGRRLLTATLDLLTAAGSSGVHLGVGPDNGRARRFYDAMGFETLLATEHVVWMGRRLP